MIASTVNAPIMRILGTVSSEVLNIILHRRLEANYAAGVPENGEKHHGNETDRDEVGQIDADHRSRFLGRDMPTIYGIPRPGSQ